MLGAATARLVEGAATLGETERVRVKGADEPVSARRLLGVPEGLARSSGRVEPGRPTVEMSAIESLLDRAVKGRGGVLCVVGSPGIGKSRCARSHGVARRRDVEVFGTFCESHATDVSFRVVAQFLRAATGVSGLHAEAARARIQAQVRDTDVGIWRSSMTCSACRSRGSPTQSIQRAPAAVDRDDQRRPVRAPTPRCTSSRTPIGSIPSASRCFPSSSRSSRRHARWS